MADEITTPTELDALRSDLIAQATAAIVTPQPPEPPEPIPVRWCPNAYTSILGHITFSEEVRDGDITRYSISFTAGPLHGEPPRYVIRLDFPENAHAQRS
ncbi:hypothetical protein [Nocardia sp. NPDC055049]